MEQIFKTIEELSKAEERKQASKELLSLRFQGCFLTSLTQTYKDTEMCELLETVQKLQKVVDKQQQLLEIGKKDHEDLKILNVLNTTKNTNDIKTEMTSIERNIEKLNNKYSILRTQISDLERESMKNSLHIFGMDHSYQTLLSTRG